jgi:hypothetical protein
MNCAMPWKQEISSGNLYCHLHSTPICLKVKREHSMNLKEVAAMALCQRCVNENSYIHLTSGTDTEKLCLRCYNGLMTAELGVEAESYPEGMTIRDGEGEAHHFQIKKRLDPRNIFMEAVEKKQGGYDFKVMGDLYTDQGELLLQLIAKAERGMAEAYVEEGTFPNGQRHHSIRNGRLAGRVEWNPSTDDVPLLAVDGKSYTWDEFGRMLMSYEGFQVKLEMLDPFEEIEWDEKDDSHSDHNKEK